jgi:hypothetical protein
MIAVTMPPNMLAKSEQIVGRMRKYGERKFAFYHNRVSFAQLGGD